MAQDAWRCSNEFGLTFRGHWKSIPSAEVLTADEVLAILNLSPEDPKYQDVINRTNFNSMYDSYFAPCDFLLTCLTVRLPQPLPAGTKYKTEFKVNGVPVQKLSVIEETDSNIITLDVDCAYPILEDDFVEMKVEVIESSEVGIVPISYPEHNLVYGVGGVVDYRYYKLLWADPDKATVIDFVANEEVDLSGDVSEIGGITITDGMIILLNKQGDARENGIYLVTGSSLGRHEVALGFSTPADLQDKYLFPTQQDHSFWTVTSIEVDPRELGEAERDYNSDYQDYLYQLDLWDLCQGGDTAYCDTLATIQ